MLDINININKSPSERELRENADKFYKQGQKDAINHSSDMHGVQSSIDLPEHLGFYWLIGEGPHGYINRGLEVIKLDGVLKIFYDDNYERLDNFSGKWIGPFTMRNLIIDMRV